MRLLHTADWHLGAHLGQFSRIEEQRLFLNQLCDIVDAEGVDMVIVAGDIFDTSNPSAAAEGLFYAGLAALSVRKIPIILVAGNHDSAERLNARTPVAAELGIIVFATPGCAEINIARTGETAVIAAMPFVTEKTLNAAIFTAKDEAGMQKDYSAKIEELFTEITADFAPDTINIAAGHFHIAGGETSRGAERDIMLGGSFAVHPAAMPAAQYIAMGHLHRAQKIKCGAGLAHYAGSPLQYSLSERGYPKGVYIADLAPGKAAVVTKIPLDCPKPIELWEVATAAGALEKCAQAGHGYKFIRITDEASLNPADIKEMRRLAPDIVSIDIVSADDDNAVQNHENMQIGDIRTEFADFYAKMRGVEPKPDILAVFDEILQNEDAL